MNKILIDKSEDLDAVMPMHNLLEYSKKYRKTTCSLWNYYRDESSDPLSPDSESFKYKTSITGNAYNAGDGDADCDPENVGKNETKFVIPLKFLSNFWRTLSILLINCEIELVLHWSKNCVLADVTETNNPPTELELQITDTRLYVPVVTLSTENDKKLLEKLK